MKKFSLFFGIFALGIFSSAQSSLQKTASDSLWGIWINEEQPDTIRLQALQQFSDGYKKTSPDSVIYFAQIQFDFALSKGLKRYMGDALSTQGYFYVFLWDHESSLNCHSRCLKIRQEIGDKKGQAMTLFHLGYVSRLMSKYTEALEYHRSALVLFLELEDFKNAALVLINIGDNYYQLGEFVQAHNVYLQALVIYEKAQNQKLISATMGKIGATLQSLGDYVLALDYVKKALTVAHESEDKTTIAHALKYMGTYYLETGNNDMAITYFEMAVSNYEELGNYQQLEETLNNLGCAHSNLNNYSVAIESLIRSIEIGFKINDKFEVAVAYSNLAELYLKIYNYPLAIDNASKSLSICLEMGVTSKLRYSSSTLIKAHLRLKNLDAAFYQLSIFKNSRYADLKNNYFTLSEREKELFYATMEDDFGMYHDFTLFYHSQFPDLADTSFNIALQNKGLSLKSSSAMRIAIAGSGDSTLISSYENWIDLKQKIVELQLNGINSTELEKTANQLEKDLIKNSEAFNDFDKIKNLNWKQVRDNLKKDECAIEFINFKSEIDTTNPIIYAAMLVKPTSEHPKIIRLCNETELEKILGNIQGNNLSFVNTVYGTKEAAQTALYEKIWQPLEEYLFDTKTIYFSPSGLLHKISFAAICKGQNVFLSDIYNFRQMGSTGNITLPEDIAFGGLENFLLMGGVNYNSNETSNQIWSYLPGSLEETNAINAYLQKKKFGVNYFKEGNASEAILKEKIVSSGIVHIATHGFFFPDPEKVREEMKVEAESNQELKFRGSTNYANWSFVNNKNPLMRSGIVLAGANDVWERDAMAEGEDGILTAQEVSNLDLRNTKLVVLSACETGLGDIKGSEGVFGLQRAFKMAGVKYLIMSLWQVPDKETSEFMQLFYTNLIKVKDIPLAFQKTQQVMRKKYDPYYWGAFVLIE